MGRADDARISHEGRLALASEYLVLKNVLSKCERHDEIFGGGVELHREFFKIAMADRKRRNRGPIPWAEGVGPGEFTDLLVEACKWAGSDGCGFCAKSRAT